MESVKVGLLGLGTVGGGTVNVIADNARHIAQRLGRSVEVVAAATRDLTKTRICNTENIELTTDPYHVINLPNVDIVVELIGGTGLAKDLVLKAIENGKHVVTANKALIAEYGNEIFKLAKQHNVIVAYEAAVAGGIPIIKAIREGFAANQIEYLAGIINGTSNFILTEMFDKGREFADVLAEAQALGYAEADPTFDIEGIDAAHKLTILASIAFGIPLEFKQTFTEGISQLTPEDMHYAKLLGYRIKHLGLAVREEDGVQLRVHPTLVPEDHLMSKVDGVMNAVLVKGNAVGPTLYYGAGAGAKPTASAVVADIVDVARVMAHPDLAVSSLGYELDTIEEVDIKSMDELQSEFYVRLQVADKAGVLSDITSTLAKYQISIDAFIQEEKKHTHDSLPIVLVTDMTQESNLKAAIQALSQSSNVVADILFIRIANFN